MTPEHCERQITRLSILKGSTSDVFEYFGALQDVPDELFTKAIDHALKTRSWFPTPAELRADCDAVNAAAPMPSFDPQVQDVVGGGKDFSITNPFTGKSVTIHVTREWKFDCDTCADSGWREEKCPEIHCGRRFDHAPHTYVIPCSCREWNPTIRRRKEASAKYSKPAEKAG